MYQKVKRAYTGRMHRVCDIVRTTITIADLKGLSNTLKAIEDDKGVDHLTKNYHPQATHLNFMLWR